MERLSRFITWLSEAVERFSTWLSEAVDEALDWILAPLAWILRGVFYVFSWPMKRIAWIFNGKMLWGALCGCMILGGFSLIGETSRHRGPGEITYEVREGFEVTEWVSENRYKRHGYWTAGGLVAVGAGLLTFGVWAVVWCMPNPDAEAKAEADRTVAILERRVAHYHVLASALDAATYERAHNTARSSVEFRNAEAACKYPELTKSRYSLSSQPTGREASHEMNPLLSWLCNDGLFSGWFSAGSMLLGALFGPMILGGILGELDAGMLAVGLGLWIVVAKVAGIKKEVYEDLQNLLAAYEFAFTKAL